MSLCFRLLAVALATVLVIQGQLTAHATGEDAANEIVPAPTQTGTIMHIEMLVEGEPVAVRQTISGNESPLFDARPVIEALQGEIRIDGTMLVVRRFQDRALMKIEMSDGSVYANDTLLGKLPEWTERAEADTWLDLNAISVMTGTHVKQDDTGRYTLTLDDRLKPQFDLDLFVDGSRIAFPSQEPRTIGSVLLLPLRDIAEAFGHRVEEDPAAGTVTVTRVQDTAEFTLVLATGLVSVNGEPRGVTPDVSYIDPVNLLLPSSAIETLTGSHVELRPGTDRVDVTLDERLAGGAMPGALVDDEARNTPLTFERLSYRVTDRGTLGASLSARVNRFNTTTHYEAAGSLLDPEALQPSWLQMEVQSLSGWYATLGDATPRHRELSGVDTSRIRGATFSRITGGGKLLAIAAGMPLSGTWRVEGDGAVPRFSGFAAGARLIDPETTREVGLSVASSESGDNLRAVASVQQEFTLGSGEQGKAGLDKVYVSADVGAFSGDRNTLGLRGQADGIYRLSGQSSLRASVSHESESFRRRNTRASDDFSGVFDDTVSARTTGRVSVDWRAVDGWDVLPNFGTSARVATVRDGDKTSNSFAGSASALLGNTGVQVALDVGVSQTSGDGDDSSSDSLALRAQRDFLWGEVQASLNSDNFGEGRMSRLVANLALNPVTRNFENGAGLIFSPSATAVISEDTQFGRFGATALATSGDAFGRRFQLTGQVSALQSISGEDARTSFFGSMSARYALSRYVRLEGSLNTDFADQTRFTLGLQGGVEFNEPRKHSQPQQGKGILTGRAFFDRNRDGLRQEDEPGVPGALVKIRNSRLALRVDNHGSYTIQNLSNGLYTLDIDVRSLPLGMLVKEDVILRATVGEGRVTQLDIPIIASGQVRGSVFVDANGNGLSDPGETRLEGARLELLKLDDDTAQPLTQFAAGFGQYAFEGLSPGRYRLSARMGEASKDVEIELDEESLFQTVPVPIAAAGPQQAPQEPDGGVQFIAETASTVAEPA